MALLRAARRTGGNRLYRTMFQVVLAAALSVLWVGTVGPVQATAAPIVPIPGTVQLKVARSGGQYSITAYGTYEEYPSRLDVYVQCAPHSCGLSMPRPCASTSEGELEAVLSEQRKDTSPAILIQRQLGSPSSASGTYSATRSWGAHAASGTYWACAYLLGPKYLGGEPVDPPQARASARLTVGAAPSPPSPRPPSPQGLGMQITSFYPITMKSFDECCSNNPSGTSGMPGIALGGYGRGTRLVFLWVAYRQTAKRVTIQFVFHNLSRGTSFKSDQIPFTIPTTQGSAGFAFDYGGQFGYDTDSGKYVKGQVYPAGTYRVDLLIGGKLAARTTFPIHG